ncbi:MAG: hypothetical protein JWN48_3901 [Myxococcaceae bacterium]|nr:hypothetical protein [Myxococcaceae bacterium]
MAQIAAFVIFFGSFIAFGVWMIRWQYKTADQRLVAWAEKLHYQVLDKEPANAMGTGPMSRSGNKQVMYRVTVLDAAGVRRRALVKIGSVSMGVLGDDLSVQWEEGAE